MKTISTKNKKNKKNLDPLKFRGKPFLGLAQLSKIYLLLSFYIIHIIPGHSQDDHLVPGWKVMVRCGKGAGTRSNKIWELFEIGDLPVPVQDAQLPETVALCVAGSCNIHNLQSEFLAPASPEQMCGRAEQKDCLCKVIPNTLWNTCPSLGSLLAVLHCLARSPTIGIVLACGRAIVLVRQGQAEVSVRVSRHAKMFSNFVYNLHLLSKEEIGSPHSVPTCCPACISSVLCAPGNMITVIRYTRQTMVTIY